MTLIEVKDITLSFSSYMGRAAALKNLSFHVNEGEILGIVGESGSGKSVCAQLIMGLISMPPGKIESGRLQFEGEDLLTFSESKWRFFRGKKVGMIFQDPMTSLNPLMTVGKQINEVFQVQQKLSHKEATKKSLELLELIEITSAEKRLKNYPHELSGGMRQRIVIAMALAGNPKVLIADEPTTALDVTVQAQILDLLKSLQKKLSMTIILISHDFGVIASMCDRVVVMYGGEVMEEGPVDQIFYHAAHPYTQALLHSTPRLDLDRSTPLQVIEGSPPHMAHAPKGCPFVTRCPIAMRVCLEQKPKAYTVETKHLSRCWKEEIK
jgi:oligopeptide transport system ATP-binding protein